MLVEKCPSKQTTCLKCNGRIGFGSLRVKKSSYGSGTKYYHLSCFKPGDPRAVNFEKHVRLCQVTEEKDVERVKKWVEKWNSQFIVKEETLPNQFKSKAVETTSSPLRRLLLETFQYLELREIEQVVAFICKEWFHITRDNEFWKTRYLAEFQPSDTSEEGNYRTKFVVQSRSCCWVCHHYVPLDKLKMKCPFRKRPLCFGCANTDKGRVTTLNSYFKYHQISSSLVSRLRFRHFIYHKFKQNYVCDLADTIIPYAEKRRQVLLESLQTLHSPAVPEATVSAVANFDAEAFYKRGAIYSNLAWKIGTFCGKNDENESVEKSVDHFLASLS